MENKPLPESNLTEGSHTLEVRAGNGVNDTVYFSVEFIVVPTAEVAWNASTLDLGSTYVGGSPLTGSKNITSNESNTNVTVVCDSGNCSIITNDWVTTNMTNQSSSVGFTCNASSVGVHTATFNVSSVEDTSPDQITVSCEITEISVEWAGSGPSLWGYEGKTAPTGSDAILSEGLNTDVTVVCDSGDCDVITEEWDDTTDMVDKNLSQVEFTCDSSTAGKYSAAFNVTSLEDETPNQITVDCQIDVMPVVWEMPTLDLSGIVGAGLITGSDNVISNTDNGETPVSVECISGDCENITDDWEDRTPMGEGESLQVGFTCNDSVVGTYSAIFGVYPDQEGAPRDEVTVTCTVTTAPEDDDDDSGAEDYECFTSSDCGECEKCNSHECVEDEKKCPPPECKRDSDCGSNEECDGGECVEVEIQEEKANEEVPLVPELKTPPEEEEEEEPATLIEQPEEPQLAPPPEEEAPPAPKKVEITENSSSEGGETAPPKEEGGDLLGPILFFLFAALMAIFLFVRSRRKGDSSG